MLNLKQSLSKGTPGPGCLSYLLVKQRFILLNYPDNKGLILINNHNSRVLKN